MKLIMVLVLVLLVMPTGSYGMDSNNRYVIRGMGGHSCAEYNQTWRNPSSRSPFWNWVGGYVTAYNRWRSNTYDIMTNRDLDSLRGWLDNYCKENPHKSFADAVGALMSELHPKRLKEKAQ